MSASRQPSPAPDVLALCGAHRVALVCPACSAPAIREPEPVPERLFLTLQETCAAMGISEATLRMLERDWGLPVIRVGQRITRVSVQSLLAWAAGYEGARR